MNGDPTNGGKRIGKLETKDAVQDTVLVQLVEQSRETHDLVAKLLPMVVRNEERISNNRVWIKALWGLGAAIAILGIKAAFFA